jgi:hypothetical protein
VDVDENDEEWRLDVEVDKININMDEIENAINVEEIVKEW